MVHFRDKVIIVH